MLIKLKRCELRPWQSGDEQSLIKNANSKKVWDNVRDYFPHPYTLKDAEEWIVRNRDVDPAVNLAIVVDGQAAGGIGIVVKEDVSRINAEIGYWLGEDYWNRNIMTEAVSAMVDYSFDNFDVIRIYAEVFEKNYASRKVLQKAGFLEEAILRFSVIKNNEIMDSYVYSILRD
ncbi:GNAT family N-acetyltransferase [Solitalea canadensis]|uniref:Acetyltransferase, ribosomal protein N-acetylase n=1 Tax=Solitalea canadensis (strain ATCC 29591 / DSM 3403 / JCM 21819 / LMG 8368 / NBRC 15130 / NCIMB 12057 / USAM 9D) TaxID=929556 RepID=H8KL60_SOLCM|nr:GNAT family N-acetyltransferase [Solitalea canadensis]AFD09143.1 acetyltransferase, ribosomal protein N-acetylase [Solitalea canadensis DSM 3403]